MTAKPNVTPLIDVLLVLLIIFMVVTPIKPSAFKAKVPTEPTEDAGLEPHPDTLIVTVAADSSLSLNRETDLGTAADPQKLIGRLRYIFDRRAENYGPGSGAGTAVPRNVFIQAPKGLSYGTVAKVVDAVKMSGADPIALQIDRLNQ